MEAFVANVSVFLGSYVLYTYMIAQRRKVMKGKQAERRNRAVTH